jgi:hypothetical protein
VPDGACYEQIRDWIDENFLTFGAVMVSIGGYMMLMPFVACGLCCNRKKDKEGYKKTKSKESSAA